MAPGGPVCTTGETCVYNMSMTEQIALKHFMWGGEMQGDNPGCTFPLSHVPNMQPI